MAIQIDEIIFGGDGEAFVDAQDSNYTLLVVQIYSPRVQQVPSSIAVSVSAPAFIIASCMSAARWRSD